MVEIHLLHVNENFRYDPIFALGVVSTFDRFMEGYEPTPDKASIFSALCRAEEMDPDQLRGDTQQALSAVQDRSAEDAIAWISQSAVEGGSDLAGTFSEIAHNPKFKYSRLFAIGLYTLIESVNRTYVADEAKLNEMVEKLSAALNVSGGKIQKDLELYRTNLDKLQQARKAVAEFIEGERRRQEKRAEEQQAATSAVEKPIPEPSTPDAP